jgi:putative phage-type endonuclease
MISASDFAQALGQGKFGTAKQLIQKKCEPVNESAFSQTNPFFKWGNMFEPVAIDIYSDLSGVKVHAFGLIKHPKYDFFGASPDGIDELGRMVEIKCPMKRTIVKGKIPTQYEYQMQGQLDVCDLDECYYFECTFGTVDNINEFNSIYKNYEYVGVIIEYEQCKYCYSGVYHSSDISVIQSINKFTDSNSKGVYHYWFLKEYNMEKVVRDPVFIKEKMKDLRVVWDKIMYYRQNKEQYVVDILNTIDIETESLYQLKENDKPKLKGYSLKDLE